MLTTVIFAAASYWRMNPKNRERFEQSTKLFIRALELDPGYSQAYAGLSLAYNLDYQNRWSDDPDSSLQLAKHNAEQAIEKDPKEPFARHVASWAAIFDKDLGRAKSEVDIALSLNPNSSGAYASLGSIQTYSGRPLEAIPVIERATRLDPAFRPGHLHFLGMAYLLAGKYETAAALLRERILLVPGTDFSRVLLASALGHLGEVDEARRIWQELKEINPKYSFSEHFARQPFKRKRTSSGLPRVSRKPDCRPNKLFRNRATIVQHLTVLTRTETAPALHYPLLVPVGSAQTRALPGSGAVQ